MKNNRIKLYTWYTNDGRDMIEIDWPKVHQTVGSDQIKWLLSQPKETCQLVVEKVCEDFALVAEFYCNKTLAIYHLMWAK
jgi:hypothetical protein